MQFKCTMIIMKDCNLTSVLFHALFVNSKFLRSLGNKNLIIIISSSK